MNKNINVCVIVLTLLVSLFFQVHVNAQLLQIDRDIAWEEFLARHDLVWSEVPKERGNSAFIGNGMIGSTVWSARDEALHWDLGRNDVYETGDRQFRVPVGKLILKTKGSPDGKFHMRQSLYRAEITGSLSTDKGTIEWRSMIHRQKMTGLVEFRVSPGEKIDFSFFQLPVANSNGLRNGLRDLIGDDLKGTPYQKIVDFSDPAYEPYLKKLKGNKQLFCHPKAGQGTSGDVHWLAQPFKEGGGYVVAYGMEEKEQGRILLAYTIDYYKEGSPDPGPATAKVQESLSEGYNKAAIPHYLWWERYYSRSFVSFPHKEAEGFYWLQLYKLASATRSDGVVLDQIGPWLRATAWARVWNNTNIQIAYHSMMTSNRLDLCEPFIRLMNQNYRNFELAVPEQKRGDGILAIGRTMDLYGRTSWVSEYGNLSWVLHDYWLYCRYSGKDDLILSKLYPLLKGAARFMINDLLENEKGQYHLPPDVSPEYGRSAKYKDVTYDLCLLRWNLNMLLHLNEQYRMHDRDAEQWQDVLDHLIPYPVNENGLMIGSETPFAESHRHYSHLMPFFPLRELDPGSPEGYALFKRTYDHWQSMPQSWNLFAHFGAGAMAAWLKEGDNAIRHVENGIRAATPSTFFPGPGPAIESVLCGLTSIGEMLIQSWTYKPDEYCINVFPSLPESWQDACFSNLRAEGAFEVSAVRKEGVLQWVEVSSLAGKPCKINAPFKGSYRIVGEREYKSDRVLDKNGKEYISIDLKKGETVQLIAWRAPGPDKTLVISPVN